VAPRRTDSSRPPIREGLEGLDRLLEHRARLAICVLLSRNDAMSFRRLKELLEETDGSLGAHLMKLETEGYLTSRKEFRERKPVTWYALSRRGREALESHMGSLARLIRLSSGARG
jgi:DNA-binding PadR family transcriptional regulator